MIVAVIPTRYHPPKLAAILPILAADGVTVCLMESDDYDHGIYRMWNAGVEMARALGADHIAVLSDDIEILGGTLPALAAMLDASSAVGVVYPNTNAHWLSAPWPDDMEMTHGTWGSGGMAGFCFMFRASLSIPFDEGYHWWFGDDQFEADVWAAGYAVARATNIPIHHEPNGSARRHWDELAPLIGQDSIRFAELARGRP